MYRATDTKLKRDVALKVLPESFTQDPQRMARFTREAQVLASLNHPNIGAIHGLEEEDGVRALVLELIEGEDLSERIAKGPILLEESLQIALQIAEALEAAHEKGIIHRDLKPANVKITPDGQIKVLDFGLAKAPAVASQTSLDLTASPTLTMQATQAGMILGTAAYMSPEQARGKNADTRSGSWGFGVILFEMLSGRKAFQGEDITLTLASVVKEEPEWELLPAEAGPLQRVLARCLTKEPRGRYHHIADVRIALEDCLADPPAAEVDQPGGGRVSLSGWTRVLFGMVLLITALLASFVTWVLVPVEAPQVVHSKVPAPDGAPFDSTEGSIAISPDGKFLAFVARRAGEDRALWVRSLASEAAQRLQGTESARGPFWSHDSRYIGFFAEGKLKKIAASGGPVDVLDSVEAFGQGTWNQDGVILFSARGAGPLSGAIYRLGSSRPVTELGRDENSHHWPRFLPDGNHFIYHASNIGPESDGKIYVSSLDGMAPQLLADGQNASYASPGYLLFKRQGTFRAQPFDLQSLAVTGEARALPGAVSGSYLSASQNGILAYGGGSNTPVSQLWWYDRSGQRLDPLGKPGNYFFPRISHDGQRVAVDFSDESNDGDLWLYELSRPIPSRFTFAAENDTLPVWSPDDELILFASARSEGKDSNDLYLKPTIRSGETELLYGWDEGDVQPSDWSRDGRSVAFNRLRTDIWVFSMEDRKAKPFLESPFLQQNGRFSPDGKWMTYVSDETGQMEVYVRPFPGPGIGVPISEDGGTMPAWSADGSELFFIARDRTLMSAKIQLGQDFKIELPQPLFATEIRYAETQPAQYDVSPGGQRFLINTLVAQSEMQWVTLVVNWDEELKDSESPR